MTIGERIKKRRKELGISVDELAAELGKNRATIYRYESSEIEKLPTTVLEPLARVLCTTPAYLMGWLSEPNDIDNSEELQYVPLDAADELDSVPERMYEFQKAVDADRAAEQADKGRTEKLLKLFKQLNDLGKERVLEWVEELTEIEKYTDKREEV